MRMIGFALLLTLFVCCNQQTVTPIDDSEIFESRLEHYVATFIYTYPNWNKNEATRRVFTDSICTHFINDITAYKLLTNMPFKLDGIEKGIKGISIVNFKYDYSIDVGNIPIYLTLRTYCVDSVASNINKNNRYCIDISRVVKYERPAVIANISYAYGGTGAQGYELGKLYVVNRGVKKIL